MRRYCKLIISTITIALIFTLCLSPASYALSSQQFGAWIASALTAINIVSQSTIAQTIQGAQELHEFLSYPFKIEDTQVIHTPYTYDMEDIEEYLQRSTISFSGEEVVIDGKHYTDVWLSHEAAEKFRVNAYDIKTAFDIANNSNGTYVRGVGSIDDTPVYEIDDTEGIARTQVFELPWREEIYKIGPYRIETYFSGEQTTRLSWHFKYRNDTYQSGNNNTINYWPLYIYVEYLKDYNAVQIRWKWRTGTSYNWIGRKGNYNGFVNEPFDFDWVSGVIPAEGIFGQEEGLHLYIPNDATEWTDAPSTQTIINNYNTYIENNPDILPDVDLDLDTPGLLDKIGDILDIIGPIIDLLKPQFGPQSQEPTPPIPPEPGDTISETPWDSLRDLLQRILNKLDDILGIRNLISNFNSAFDSATSSILNQLNNIFQSIGQLPEFFESHVINTIKDALSGIKNFFLPIFALLKASLGIWHYVIEWFTAISTPFQFYLNVISSGYPLITVPIYAAIAGVICIAVYRRFGR